MLTQYLSGGGVSGSSGIAPEYMWVKEFPDEALAVGVDGAGEA